MKQKIFILTLGYFALGIATFTACSLSYDASICDIQFTGLHSMGNFDDEEPDTFENQIGFEILALPSSPTCYIPPIEVFSSAVATTKCAVYQNQLLKSTYQISLDRPIILNNDTISANTDLLNLPEINSLTEITIDEECKLVTSQIIFTSELTNQIEFESGVYLVTFQCSTSDSRLFTKTRKVIFKD